MTTGTIQQSFLVINTPKHITDLWVVIQETDLLLNPGWAPKNWYFRTVVWQKTLDSPLDCKEIQPVHPKGDQSWIFIGRTDVEAETPILWPPDGKNWLNGKDPDAGKDWRQEEKEMTEDEMGGWHHQLNGHECEQTLGDSEEQGSLKCCSPWGLEESDTTSWLNDNTISYGYSQTVWTWVSTSVSCNTNSPYLKQGAQGIKWIHLIKRMKTSNKC